MADAKIEAVAVIHQVEDAPEKEVAGVDSTGIEDGADAEEVSDECVSSEEGSKDVSGEDFASEYATHDDASDEEVSTEDANRQKRRRRRRRRRRRKSHKNHESKDEKRDQPIEENLVAVPVEVLEEPLRTPEPPQQSKPMTLGATTKSKLSIVRRKIKHQMKVLRKKVIRSVESVRKGLKKAYKKLKLRRKKTKIRRVAKWRQVAAPAALKSIEGTERVESGQRPTRLETSTSVRIRPAKFTVPGPPAREQPEEEEDADRDRGEEDGAPVDSLDLDGGSKSQTMSQSERCDEYDQTLNPFEE